MKRAVVAGLLVVVAVPAAVVLWRKDQPPAVERRSSAVAAAPSVASVSAASTSSLSEPVAPPTAPDDRTYEPGEVPDELIGTGTCSVRIRLVDQDGAPVETYVRLWRLGLPESGEWTAGDQVQVAAHVAATGTELTGLPAGRYRAEIDAQRVDAEDPPELVVRGDEVVDLPVAMPRTQTVRCSLFGADRAPISHVGVRPGRRSGWYRHRTVPAWADPRCSPRTDRPAERFSGDGRRTPGSLEADAQDGVFDLATIWDSRRTGRVSDWSWTLETTGRSAVVVRARSDSLPAEPLAGISVPLSGLAADVLLPDGRRATDVGAKVEAESDAVLPPPGADPFEAARAAPIRVKVTLDGYERLEFDWRVGDALPGSRVLVAK